MSGRLQGFLGFLDLLAEGERRHAELIAGRRFEPALRAVAGSASRGTENGSKAVKSYSTIRNTSLAAALVATLAGLVSNGLALDQRVVYERDILGIDPATVLPEIVVTARRLET
jgi:hypothetical protein